MKNMHFVQYCTSLLLIVIIPNLVQSETVCEDRTKSCEKWLKKDLCNEVSKYKKQRFYVAMGRLCKKACKMCGNDDYELVDTDARCNSYYKKGYCDETPHQGFMLKRCKYSCRNTIRHGISSPGRGNFQRPSSNRLQQQPKQQQQQQQQAAQNAMQADYTNPMHWGQQYANQYAHQYGNYQYPQYATAQQNGQQYPQQQYAQQQQQQQYGQQNTQQNDAYASPQQSTSQQASNDQSLLSLPVQVQQMSKLQNNEENNVVNQQNEQNTDKKHTIKS